MSHDALDPKDRVAKRQKPCHQKTHRRQRTKDVLRIFPYTLASGGRYGAATLTTEWRDSVSTGQRHVRAHKWLTRSSYEWIMPVSLDHLGEPWRTSPYSRCTSRVPQCIELRSSKRGCAGSPLYGPKAGPLIFPLDLKLSPASKLIKRVILVHFLSHLSHWQTQSSEFTFIEQPNPDQSPFLALSSSILAMSQTAATSATPTVRIDRTIEPLSEAVPFGTEISVIPASIWIIEPETDTGLDKMTLAYEWNPREVLELLLPHGETYQDSDNIRATGGYSKSETETTTQLWAPDQTGSLLPGERVRTIDSTTHQPVIIEGPSELSYLELRPASLVQIGPKNADPPLKQWILGHSDTAGGTVGEHSQTLVPGRKYVVRENRFAREGFARGPEVGTISTRPTLQASS